MNNKIMCSAWITFSFNFFSPFSRTHTHFFPATIQCDFHQFDVKYFILEKILCFSSCHEIDGKLNFNFENVNWIRNVNRRKRKHRIRSEKPIRTIERKYFKRFEKRTNGKKKIKNYFLHRFVYGICCRRRFFSFRFSFNRKIRFFVAFISFWFLSQFLQQNRISTANTIEAMTASVTHNRDVFGS